MDVSRQMNFHAASQIEASSDRRAYYSKILESHYLNVFNIKYGPESRLLSTQF